MEADFRRALYEALLVFAAGRGRDGADLFVAFPNAEFDRPTSSDDDDPLVHLVASTLPTGPRTHGINNGESRYVWLAQVDVYVRDGFGEVLPLELLDELRVAFPFDHELVGAEHRFRVIRPLATFPPIPDDGWFSTPAQLRIQTIA